MQHSGHTCFVVQVQVNFPDTMHQTRLHIQYQHVRKAFCYEHELSLHIVFGKTAQINHKRIIESVAIISMDVKVYSKELSGQHIRSVNAPCNTESSRQKWLLPVR